jgi:hypothetical protein
MAATKINPVKKDIVKLATQVHSKTSFTFPSNVQVTITSETMQTIYKRNIFQINLTTESKNKIY